MNSTQYQVQLTSRETEILINISNGRTTREIAHKLYLSPHTIIAHRRNLLSKLNAKNCAELVRRAFENGLLQIN